MDYITKNQNQYKANLHCHSDLSDGNLKPEELVLAYQEHGYSVLAITDHESTYDHSHLTTPSFLLLTGYEAYIRPSADCVYDRYSQEIHLNLLAKDPHNTAIVAYDPPYCKYMSKKLAESRIHVGNLGPRKYTREYINAYIQAANETGYLVTYNHPCWSMEREEDILSYDGLFSLEIFNSQSMIGNGFECNLSLYDKFLRNGKFLYCHGADDNHNGTPFNDLMNDSFLSWTMILAPELTYPAIIDALEKGNFYASTGPVIKELTFDGTHVHLECSPVQKIYMQLSPKKSLRVYNHDGSPVTSADFEIPEEPPFVYFSIFAENGTSAHTRGFTREELGI